MPFFCKKNVNFPELRRVDPNNGASTITENKDAILIKAFDTPPEPHTHDYLLSLAVE